MNADHFELDASTLFVMWIDRFDQILGLKSNSESSAAVQMTMHEANAFVGTNLFDYVLGHFTRQFLRKFLNSVRETSEQKRMLYRCDSPSHKQLMEMRACVTSDGEIRISHRLVETEAFGFEVNLHTASKPQNSRILRCSICNRLRYRGTNDWREPENIEAAVSVLHVIHTVCPECRSGLKVKPIFGRVQT